MYPAQKGRSKSPMMIQIVHECSGHLSLLPRDICPSTFINRKNIIALIANKTPLHLEKGLFTFSGECALCTPRPKAECGACPRSEASGMGILSAAYKIPNNSLSCPYCRTLKIMVLQLSKCKSSVSELLNSHWAFSLLIVYPSFYILLNTCQGIMGHR
jgi:hypothetical protein